MYNGNRQVVQELSVVCYQVILCLIIVSLPQLDCACHHTANTIEGCDMWIFALFVLLVTFVVHLVLLCFPKISNLNSIVIF